MSLNLEHSSPVAPPGIVYNRHSADMADGTDTTQRQILEREGAGSSLKAFAPVFVPGLLQTRAYAYARLIEACGLLGLPEDAIDATVTTRMARGDLLEDGSRELHAVIAESALYIGGAATNPVMMGQLRKLLRVMAWPNVRLGVLPTKSGRGWRAAHPMSHLNIVDADEVTVETLAVTYRITDGPEIGMYLRVFDGLAAAAEYGDDAKVFIEAALSWWGRSVTHA